MVCVAPCCGKPAVLRRETDPTKPRIRGWIFHKRPFSVKNFGTARFSPRSINRIRFRRRAVGTLVVLARAEYFPRLPPLRKPGDAQSIAAGSGITGSQGNRIADNGLSKLNGTALLRRVIGVDESNKSGKIDRFRRFPIDDFVKLPAVEFRGEGPIRLMASTPQPTDDFNPYYEWLAFRLGPLIDHYRLLGVPRFEGNAKVISDTTPKWGFCGRSNSANMVRYLSDFRMN